MATDRDLSTICTAMRPFFNVVDRSDVIMLACDLEQGHGGNHHDPGKDVEWRPTRLTELRAG